MNAPTAKRLLQAVLLALIMASPASRTLAADQAEASRVRILLVADMTGDEREQQRRAKNIDLVRKALEEGLAAQGMQKRCTLQVFQKSKATPNGLLDYYSNLHTDPSETLFCYINCHGGGDDNNRHFMILGNEKLYHSQLRAAMQKKKPRLAVLITESCYSHGENSTPAITPKGKKDKHEENSDKGLVLRQLLYRAQGLVDIQAAKPGNLAKGSPTRGNIFTRAFTGLLDQPLSHFDRNADGLVDWSEFYSVLKRETIRLRNDQNQPPYAFSLAKKAA